MLLEIERRLLASYRRDRVLANSNLASAVPGNESFRFVEGQLKQLGTLTLPYLEGQSNMVKEPVRKEIKEDLAAWRAFLQKRQEGADLAEVPILPAQVES